MTDDVLLHALKVNDSGIPDIYPITRDGERVSVWVGELTAQELGQVVINLDKAGNSLLRRADELKTLANAVKDGRVEMEQD